MRFRPCTLLPALVVTLAACGDPAGPADAPALITELPRELTVNERAVIHGSNRFALDLLREVAARDTEAPNVFLSPLSASMALGMTMNGADGDTWTQMRDALGFEGLEEQAINEAYRDLIELLRTLDPRVTFEIANAIWSDAGFPFHDAFYDRVTEYFDAELRELDLQAPGTPDVINGWVDEKTHGRISEIIEGPVDPWTIMFLINAIYFDGDWRQQFDPDRTMPQPFYRADGSQVTVPMMTLDHEFRTLSTELAYGVELPYGGDAFAAVVVQPQYGRTLDELLAALDADTWAAWMAELDEQESGREATVQLPRFELEYERRLNDDLRALGMVDVFDPGRADLSRLTPDPTAYVSDVKQKTFVKLDEEGTEAAAVTVVEVRTVSAPPTFRFDRPFVFAIRERLSGTILFIGGIGDPS
jgi:serine protease inhibitor